jgi:hypothetical protein
MTTVLEDHLSASATALNEGELEIRRVLGALMASVLMAKYIRR